jgi:hypothetical protein
MSRRNNVFAALGIFALASLAPLAAKAESESVTVSGETNWRATFQDAKYNKPCPLTVYSDDMSVPTSERRAVLSPAPAKALEERAGKAASEDVFEYVRSPDFVGADDLGAYAEDLSRGGKL